MIKEIFLTLKPSWDFKSTYKSIWLTRFLLITWRYDDTLESVLKSLYISFYPTE